MRQDENIPLVDLKAQYLNIKNEIDRAIGNCISDANFIKGKPVSDFEKKFSGYIGVNECVSCGNGTDALELILKALEIGPGDEVIVPALTWIATAEAVSNVGAEPVFIDINLNDYTIDTEKIEELINFKTKAIIPVHLYGCPCDMDPILEIAERNKLFVIEDCAQAHGAEYSGRKVGSFGIASAFSFFPSKNLGAFGDGGAVVSSNGELAEKIRMLANHGQLKLRHFHQIIGRNSRLDTLQAAVLNIKLDYLDAWNEKRIEASNHYRSRLNETKSIIIPEPFKKKKHVFHIYAIRSKERERIIESLNNSNISSGIHYPKPLPFLEAYSYKQHVLKDFPNAVKVSEEILSLPIYPEISEVQIDAVCDAIVSKLFIH